MNHITIGLLHSFPVAVLHLHRQFLLFCLKHLSASLPDHQWIFLFLTQDSPKCAVDIPLLKKYEEKYGDPVLWNAITADRRIYLGKKATFKQDYSKHFHDQQINAILQTGIQKIEKLIEEVNPDMIISFICVTIGEYLTYLIAKSLGITFLNLRPTRIKNYIYAGESIHEPSDKIENTYHQILNTGPSGNEEHEIPAYLNETRGTHAMYEGVVPATACLRGKHQTAQRNRTNPVRVLGSLFKNYYRYNFGKFQNDNSHPFTFYPVWHKFINRKLTILKTNRYLSKLYFNPDKLSNLDYAFFPLHKEPEVTLMVYSRPFMNQIETIRNLARSLPVGMKLLVKEHPACIGYRSLSYYKKILKIPNVLLIAPNIESRRVVEASRIVAIISGSIGLEAIIRKKPVIHFGNVPFSFLPNTMIRGITNMHTIAETIIDLLNNHTHDEKALGAYIAAVMAESVPIDFYSVLLGREEAFNPAKSGASGDALQKRKTEHINRLAQYLMQRMKQRSGIVQK